MLESLFNKVTGLKAYNFIKKRLQRRNFTVKFAKFSKTTCFTEHIWWLFLALFLRSTCCPQINYYQCLTGCIQRQPSRGVPRKRCSENMQQIYRRTPTPKCDFNEVAKHLRSTSRWLLLIIFYKRLFCSQITLF